MRKRVTKIRRRKSTLNKVESTNPQNTKTIRQLLMLLPSPYKLQALQNTTKELQSTIIDIDECDRLCFSPIAKALKHAFDWKQVQQPFEYWESIYRLALNEKI